MTIYYSIQSLQQRYENRCDLVAINLYRHERYRMAFHFWKRNLKEIQCESARCGLSVNMTNRQMWRLLVQHATVV